MILESHARSPANCQPGSLIWWNDRYIAARRKRLIGRFLEAFAMTSQNARTLRKIIQDVASRHGMTEAEIISHKRAKAIVWPRHEAMYRCLVETRYSTNAVGRIFGRDHSTVICGARAHARRYRLPLPTGVSGQPLRDRR